MANSHLKLIYFDGMGRAEAARLLLVAAGKQFDDIRLPEEDWPQHSHLAPFGQCPLLVVDGVTYAQSVAIKTYLARELGFYGHSNIESLQIDQLVQLIEDLTNICVPVVILTDEEQKRKELARIKADVSPIYLGHLERLLKENGTGYFVDNRLTLADLVAFDVVTGMLKDYVDVTEKYPLLQKNVDIVRSDGKIRPYVKSRPITPF
ncbi:unnamed protein product [Candidula unifasciata]|uniref:Glutathione transferase n=1 Tax=Candidula unifasciata TaxID=100452 RepID=A0A8S3YTD0_9EUPU|nr:unnamed protein product [Candidula unifasciata]